MDVIRGKRRNHRLFPGAKHRPDFYRSRREEAKERQTAWDNLSIPQKLALLDIRLGKDVGAVKQRARLASLLEKQNQPKPAPQSKKDVAPTPVGEEAKDHQHKKYMKGNQNENS